MIDEHLHPGDALVERRLREYAAARLEPDPTAMARVRAVLVAEARRAAVVREAEVVARAAYERSAAAPDPTPGRRWPFASWGTPRAVVAFGLAVLVGLTGGASVFAASRAGGPLYEARLWVESATLPADPDARLQAELARALDRLAEASDAYARGDAQALEAALVAYSAIVDEAVMGVSDATGLARAGLAVEHHRSILAALQAKVPPRAAAAIADALEHSDRAIDALGGLKGGGPGAAPPAERPEPTRGPDPSQRPDRTPAAGTPKPERPQTTPKPEKTSKPSPATTPEPAATPKAGATPAPGKPEEPPSPGRTPPVAKPTPPAP